MSLGRYAAAAARVAVRSMCAITAALAEAGAGPSGVYCFVGAGGELQPRKGHGSGMESTEGVTSIVHMMSALSGRWKTRGGWTCRRGVREWEWE